MSRFKERFILLCFLMVELACVNFGGSSIDYDSRRMKVQLLSLFNQRTQPIASKKTWKGDWLFRRERLTLIDKELGDTKPDLIFFQEMMKKDSNPFESDQGILSAGVLHGYKWHLSEPRIHTDSGEEEFLAMAITPPLQFSDEASLSTLKLSNNAMVWKDVKLEKQSVLLVNLKLDISVKPDEVEKIIQEIKNQVQLRHICKHRVIIAAYVPTEVYSVIAQLSDALHLQDSSRAFCNIESSCFTTHSRNQLFQITYGERLAAKVDFILVPKSAVVFDSHLQYTSYRELKVGYFKEFGLEALWPSDRFGWQTEFVLGRCSF